MFLSASSRWRRGGAWPDAFRVERKGCRKLELKACIGNAPLERGKPTPAAAPRAVAPGGEAVLCVCCACGPRLAAQRGVARPAPAATPRTSAEPSPPNRFKTLWWLLMGCALRVCRSHSAGGAARRSASQRGAGLHGLDDCNRGTALRTPRRFRGFWPRLDHVPGVAPRTAR